MEIEDFLNAENIAFATTPNDSSLVLLPRQLLKEIPKRASFRVFLPI